MAASGRAPSPSPPTLGQTVQLDLFFPIQDLSDVPLRDYQETMQRPFFSLAKNKRTRPILYKSPDGKVTVEVQPNLAYGMATIWDADILIFLASVVNEKRQRRENELSPTISVQPADLLQRIGWGTGGKAYERLTQALDRLQSTTIKTNIRAEARRESVFSWIESYTHLVNERTNRPLGMEITMSKWFFDGLQEKNLLRIDPGYFDITSGLAKWLYRAARKHAGGNGAAGFTINLDTLHAKSGSERSFPAFKKAIVKLVKEDPLPDIHLELINPGGLKPQLRMVMRDHMDGAIGGECPVKAPRRSSRPSPPVGSDSTANLREKRKSRGFVAASNMIDADIYADIRSSYPGWDYDNLLKLFDEFLDVNPDDLPANYSVRFRGFVAAYDKRNRHTLL